VTMNESAPDDFSVPPPSRRLPRAEFAGLTEEEIRDADARRLLGERPWQPPERFWAPGAPSPPEVLKLLEYPHHQDTGMPLPPEKYVAPPEPGAGASDAAHAAYQGLCARLEKQYREAERSYRARFAWWAGASAAVKTQLCADIASARQPAGAPSWRCCVLSDPIQPEAVLKAQDENAARALYKRLTGIRYVEPKAETDFAEPISVVLYEPAPATA
jgi:hypothetical protein